MEEGESRGLINWWPVMLGAWHGCLGMGAGEVGYSFYGFCVFQPSK